MRDRVAGVPLWLAATIFAIAQVADLATALRVTRELNPIVAALMAQPVVGILAKVGLIVFVIAVAIICDRRRPALARFLLSFGAVAGLAGVITNTHLTPFVG